MQQIFLRHIKSKYNLVIESDLENILGRWLGNKFKVFPQV